MKKVDKSPKRTNSLRYYANKYVDSPTDNAIIRNHDVSKLFFNELKFMLMNKERINITMLGTTREGKSTQGIFLGNWINEQAVKLKVFPENKKFGINNIARSQSEMDKLMRDPTINNTVIVVDEFAESDETGENITVIQAIRNQISDVHAGRYVHQIWISPTEIMDKNSQIILQVETTDKKNCITMNWLWYKLFKANHYVMQLLGYVDINVKSLISNWINYDIESKFYKFNRSKEDNDLIEYWRKKDFYVEYMCRKFEKMEMLTREKIFKERDLDYAELTLNVVKQLKPLCKVNILDNKIVESFTRIEARKLDLPFSILGSNIASEKIYSILKLWNAFHKVNKILAKTEKDYINKKIQYDDYFIKINELKQVRDNLTKTISEIEKEFEKLVSIKKKYDKLN